ncbi:MAG: hypothetical protein H6741_34240 [Alphaproteobacteria bacterium]|nr:hypothetical protein [Alphaproteobacteria bacterium]
MMTLTLILSFFACADHSAPSTGGATCEAEPGRVRDIESGKTYDTLDEVDWTDGKSHHLCLGQGKHVVEGPLLALNSEDPEPPEISLQGAGPLTTRIVPLDPEGLRIIAHGRLHVESLGFAGPADLVGGDVSIIDASVHSVEAPDMDQMFTVYGESIDIDGLSFTNNLVEQGLFTFGGRDDASPITVRGLRVYDNRATEAMDMVIRDGDIVLEDVEIFNNVDIALSTYQHFFTTWGRVYAEGVSITQNDVNGPAITVGDEFSAHELEVSDHRSEWGATLYLGAPARLEGSELRRNDSPDGAIGLYRTEDDVGELWLQDSDLGGGPWDNLRCDVSWRGYCLLDDLDMVDELVCDDHGCR